MPDIIIRQLGLEGYCMLIVPTASVAGVTTPRTGLIKRVFIGESRDVIAITRVVVKELTIAKATVIYVKVEIAYHILLHTFVGVWEQLQRRSLSSTSKRKKL